MLHLRYHLSEEEYFEYNYYTAWAAPNRKKYRIIYYLRVLFLYGGVSALYILTNPAHRQVIDISVFGTIAVGYFLLIPFLIKHSVKRRTKQMLEQPENRHILESCEVILTDTSIVDKDKATETRYSWEAIVNKGETPNCYYLYTNSYHAIVIPKRSMQDEADNKELERLLIAHLPLSTDYSGE